jgi:uncharacterized protein (DUF488 family)
MAATLLTIGHSRHPLADFIGLLRRHGVAVLADVRSHPWSRFSPHFNRQRLERALADAGIRYVFLGEELGARSADPACQRDGRVDYDLLAARPGFVAALAGLRAAAQGATHCLMCAERDPLECHRTLLVGVRLRSPELALAHLLADGAREAHERSEARLLARHGLDQPELFRDAGERLAEAYRRQIAAIAYRPGG